MDVNDPETFDHESPRHGYRGSKEEMTLPPIPRGLTIAISREAGARGSTIGRRVARRLSFQTYDQELLEYLAQDENLLGELAEDLREQATRWVRDRISSLRVEREITRKNQFEQAARAPLCLAALGNVVLVGRGAGFLLPVETTVHVRLLAPLEERVAYLSQWMRLTKEEARERAVMMDQRRKEFLSNVLGWDVEESYQYDLLLCSSRLGEDLCVELIVQTALWKSRQRWGKLSDPLQDKAEK